MSKRERRIMIVDCCEQRFSKIVDYWPDEPVIDTKMALEIHPGQLWDVFVYEMFPKNSDANSNPLDAVFAVSNDENLFDCLCDALGEHGWFEEEEACANFSF